MSLNASTANWLVDEEDCFVFFVAQRIFPAQVEPLPSVLPIILK